MELVLVIFSAISAISTAILAFLLWQMQNSLNITIKKKNESDARIYDKLERLLQRNQATTEQKFTELIEAQSQSSDQIYELLRGSGDLQIDRLQTIVDKLDADSQLIKKTNEFLHRQSEQLQTVSDGISTGNQLLNKTHEVLHESGELQSGKLQQMIDEIETITKITKYIASLHESVRKGGDRQSEQLQTVSEQLQTVADKVESLKNSLEESIKF